MYTYDNTGIYGSRHSPADGGNVSEGLEEEMATPDVRLCQSLARALFCKADPTHTRILKTASNPVF